MWFMETHARHGGPLEQRWPALPLARRGDLGPSSSAGTVPPVPATDRPARTRPRRPVVAPGEVGATRTAALPLSGSGRRRTDMAGGRGKAAIAVGLAVAAAASWAVARASRRRRDGDARLARLESRWDRVRGLRLHALESVGP